LAKEYVREVMGQNGFTLQTDQVDTDYPFDTIRINRLDLEGYLFSFELDLAESLALDVTQIGSNEVLEQLTFDELKDLPTQIQAEEAAEEQP
jgi:hypothetical protein